MSEDTHTHPQKNTLTHKGGALLHFFVYFLFKTDILLSSYPYNLRHVIIGTLE